MFLSALLIVHSTTTKYGPEHLLLHFRLHIGRTLKMSFSDFPGNITSTILIIKILLIFTLSIITLLKVYEQVGQYCKSFFKTPYNVRSNACSFDSLYL